MDNPPKGSLWELIGDVGVAEVHPSGTNHPVVLRVGTKFIVQSSPKQYLQGFYLQALLPDGREVLMDQQIVENYCIPLGED
jgi:hypothetical protein